MEEIKRAYIISGFDIKTDIMMRYPLKFRDISYSEEDLKNNISYILENIYNEYKDITNINISYDDFYKKSDLVLEVSAISLNRRNIVTKEEYEKYLSEIKNISKEDLKDYLLDCVNCTFAYDYNLNLKYTNTNVFDDPNFNYYYRQHSFSYKALFPEKYHVDKYKIGDKVLYDGEICAIEGIVKPGISIYDSDDPLDYQYGYILRNNHGRYIADDKFEYSPVDEDLEPIKD